VAPVVLVTGASGTIGTALCPALRGAGYTVLALSRQRPDAAGLTWLQGDFTRAADLDALAQRRIDAVIHLAAVKGGCSEADAFAVNVDGTRLLMRRLLEQGVRKVVFASSIAACGARSEVEPAFVPRRLPIDPEHPFIGHEAYGLSKYLDEEILRCFARQRADTDITSLRIGYVFAEATYEPTPLAPADIPRPMAFIELGRVMLRDVVQGILAALARRAPGYHQYNLVGPESFCETPVGELLPLCFPEAELDPHAFAGSGHHFDPVYSMWETERDLGFTSQVPVRPATFRQWRACFLGVC